MERKAIGSTFKMKGSPMQRNFGIGGSPMRDKTKLTPKELAEHKKRMQKHREFYETRKDEFTKDEQGVYRDKDKLSVKERRRIYNREKRAQERDRQKYEAKDPR